MRLFFHLAILSTSLVLTRAQDVATITSEINTLAEQRSDIAFALKPNMTQWQFLLLPTPTIVKIIGQMVVISSKVDQTLAHQTPTNGWKFVENPTSLRASLLQVSNDGWDAFHVAHKSMDYISITMAVVPRHVKTALKILAMKQIPFNTVSRLLTSPLSAIERAGDGCVASAVGTQEAFLRVMGLTAELSVAVAGTQGANDVAVLEARAQLNATRTQKQLMEEQKARMIKHYDEQRKVVSDARAAYEKAIDKIPTGFKAFAMDLIQSLGPSIVGGMMGVPVFGGGKKGGGGGSYQTAGNETREPIHDQVILQMMRGVADRLPQIRQNIEQALGGEGDLGANEIRNFFITIRAMFEESMTRFTTYPNTAVKVMAQRALQTLLKVADGLEKSVNEMRDNMSEDVKQEIREKVDEVAADLEALVSAGISTGSTGGTSVSQARGGGVGANERFIAQSRLSNLGSAETRLDGIFRDINTFNQELTNVEVQLRLIDIRRVNLVQVRELLRQVLSLLGQIRELWSRLVEFFSIVSTRAKVMNANYLRVFRELAETSGDAIASGGVDDRSVFIELLQQQALDINTVSHLLHVMGKTYVRISSDAILGKMAGMAKLLAAKDDDERQRWFNQLDSDGTEARESILQIIQAQKADYARAVLAKRRRLTAAIAALGGPQEADAAAIEAGDDLAAGVLDGSVDVLPPSEDDDWNMDNLIL